MKLSLENNAILNPKSLEDYGRDWVCLTKLFLEWEESGKDKIQLKALREQIEKLEFKINDKITKNLQFKIF